MATIQEKLTLLDQFSANFSKFIALAERAAASAENVQASLNNISQASTATAQAATGMYSYIQAQQKVEETTLKVAEASQEAEKKTQEFISAQKSSHSTMNSTSNYAEKLNGKIKALAGTYLGMQGLSWLTETADMITQSTARINRMNDGLQTTEQLQNMIFQTAQETRSSYSGMLDAVSKFGTLAGDAFSSSAEVVAFTEQLSKQFALAGTSTEGQAAAMLQLTQAMGAGVLRGEELNSVLEQAPNIVQTIADYMGTTVAGVRELASDGQVTAEVVKNALLSAADETNATFEETPMTWAQLWTTATNSIQQTLMPLLNAVASGAEWIGDNWNTLLPILSGLAAGALAYAAALAIQTAATWVANGAAVTFFTTLLTNPLTYIVIAIALVVMAIVKWVQSVGGLQVAWLICVNAILTAWDLVKIGFMTGVYWVMDLWDKMNLSFQRVSVAIQNFMGDMKVGVLNILQDMVNGGIDIINWFIEKLNKIPGVSLDAIEKMSFGTEAAIKNEAEKQARNADLAAYESQISQNIADRAAALEEMKESARAAAAQREAEILAKQSEAASENGETGLGGTGTESSPYSSDLSSIASDTSSIKKSVDMSQEDIKSLVDMAERRYINNINLTSQTPVITINGANTGNTAEDRQALANSIRDVLVEQMAAGSVRSTARAW